MLDTRARDQPKAHTYAGHARGNNSPTACAPTTSLQFLSQRTHKICDCADGIYGLGLWCCLDG